MISRVKDKYAKQALPNEVAGLLYLLSNLIIFILVLQKHQLSIN